MNLVSFGLFTWLFLQLVIAWWASRRVANEDDYLVAGRSLGLPLVTLSLFATWFGAETIMGSTAMVAEQGLSGARADPFGYAITLLAMGLFIAYRLRSRGYLTIGDFLADRFGRTVEWLGSVVLIPSVITWAGAQLLAFGNIVHVITGLDLGLTITFAAVLVIFYTSLGGLLGDVWTDVVQGAVVIAGIAILFVEVLDRSGGIAPLLAGVAPERWQLVPTSESPWARLELWAIPILGSLVSQVALSRVLAARTAAVARQACIAAFVIYLAVGLMPVTIALAAPQLGLELTPGDGFLPGLAGSLLPPWMYLIFMSALVSAILSTIDSSLLTVSALLSHNVIMPAIGAVSGPTRLVMHRALVVFAGIAAWVVATLGERILDLVIFADSIGTAGVVVVVILGLYSRLGDGRAATITLVAGMISPVLLGEVFALPAPWMASVVVCLLVYLVVSRMRGKNGKRVCH